MFLLRLYNIEFKFLLLYYGIEKLFFNTTNCLSEHKCNYGQFCTK